MIRMEISGTGNEIRNEMLMILGLSENRESSSTVTLPTSETEGTSEKPTGKKRGRKPVPKPWTEDEAKQFLDAIRPNARRIIGELASKPEGYKKNELVQALGLAEPQIRGQLSSVGATMRKMDNKPYPISKKMIDGRLTYIIDPTIANVAKQQY